MSNDARGSKKNKPNDANHVNAKTKANQRRISEKNNQQNNGKVQ